MNAIKLKRRIDSEVLIIPDLIRFIGKNVEIVCIELPSDENDDYDLLKSLRNSVTEYINPTEPVGMEDWELLQ